MCMRIPLLRMYKISFLSVWYTTQTMVYTNFCILWILEGGTAPIMTRIYGYELGFMFLLGCFIYSLLEITARGFTHWTMTLLGGTVGIVLYLLHCTAPPHTLLWQAFTGAWIITALEMVVGVIDNLILDWHVWSYADMPLNLFGQICLPFSVLWFAICIPALGLCAVVRKRLTEAIQNFFVPSL